jgi:DNA-binding FadR family transcriptional regulator
MRLEATVPDARAKAVVELAKELGVNRSHVIDEALSLFLKAAVEIKRGRRLFLLDPNGAQPPCELSTPALSTLEWTSTRETVELPTEALVEIGRIVADPPKPSNRLRTAAKRQGWSKS